MNVPLQSPDYSCISKRAKTVEIKYRLPSHGPVAHLVIDATGLKVYGEGEWKIRKHGKEKRRVSIHRNSIDTGKMRRSSLDPTFLLA